MLEKRGRRIDRQQRQAVELQPVEDHSFGNRLEGSLRIERADDGPTDRTGDGQVARSPVGVVHRQLGEIQQAGRDEQCRGPIRGRIEHRRQHGADQSKADFADRLDTEAAAGHLPEGATLVDGDRHGDSQSRKRAVGSADENGDQRVGPCAARRDSIRAAQLCSQMRRGAHRQANAGDIEGGFRRRQWVAVRSNERAQASDGHRQARRQQERRANVGDSTGIGVPASAHLELQMVADRG